MVKKIRDDVIAQLKIKLKQLEIDYFLVPNSDQFFLEFLPERQRRVKFLTGFEGSNAFLIISEQKSYFFTDGRYLLQAANEINCSEFEIVDISLTSPIAKLEQISKAGQKIALDPKLHNVKFVKKVKDLAHNNNFSYYFFKLNPVDQIWNSDKINKTELKKPDLPVIKVVNHPKRYAGIAKKDKIKKLLNYYQEDAILISESESICWLFNIRCHGAVQYSPILPCYAILYRDGNYDFFLDYDGSCDPLAFYQAKKFNNRYARFRIKPSQEFTSIAIDPRQTNQAIYQGLLDSGKKVKFKNNEIINLKAVKNEVEVKNFIKAHEVDGLALTKFLCWLDAAVESGKVVDELSAEEKLLEFRSQDPSFIYDSFRSISGFAENGAVIHYHASKKTNKKFKKGSLYLIDSGGQYQCGTTDVTRTVAIGEPTNEMKKDFTNVLKGHIAIALSKFDKDTSGAELDIKGRRYLLKDGKDYAHGTGHGVGSYLSVHEGPCSISKYAKNSFFKEGMVVSNEPGYYLEGCYGIRIENLVLVKKDSKKSLCFDTLTLVPIDPRLVMIEELTLSDKKWLKSYHDKILFKYKSKLNDGELTWMLSIYDFYNNL